MREKFQQQLNALRDDILVMGSMVEEELKLALQALENLDAALMKEVYAIDKKVNRTRLDIEERCFTIISTQQPTASDLRAIIAVMNMIVDLERMGDQAKGVVKVLPTITQYLSQPLPAELGQMGSMVDKMLHDSMAAYVQEDLDLAEEVVNQDRSVDALFAQLYQAIMKQMAATDNANKVEAWYDVLRVARELERFGDLATNVAERVIYRKTGKIQEVIS